MDATSIEHHIKHLQKQHDNLDRLIQEEYSRYQDDNSVAHLKKEKLALRDEIDSFKSKLNTL
jgi:hypothetical protein